MKDTINHTATLMGKRDALKYHFMAHHWVHNSATALNALAARKEKGSMKEVFAERDQGHPPAHERAARAAIRVIDVGTRISAPFCAGLLGELGADVIKVELPGEGDFMRTMGPFVPVDDGPDYSLSWAVEGRGRRGVTCDLRQPEGKELFKRLVATADVLCENFRPGTMENWGLGPDDLARRPRLRAHQRLRPERARTRPAPGSTAWASPSADCSTSPAIPTGRPCGPASPCRTT